MSQYIEYTELQMAKLEFKDSTKYRAAVKGEEKMNLWILGAQIRKEVAGQDYNVDTNAK